MSSTTHIALALRPALVAGRLVLFRISFGDSGRSPAKPASDRPVIYADLPIPAAVDVTTARRMAPSEFLLHCETAGNRLDTGNVALWEYQIKGKVFPYSLPSVGPGADPGVVCTGSQPAGDVK